MQEISIPFSSSSLALHITSELNSLQAISPKANLKQSDYSWDKIIMKCKAKIPSILVRGKKCQYFSAADKGTLNTLFLRSQASQDLKFGGANSLRFKMCARCHGDT